MWLWQVVSDVLSYSFGLAKVALCLCYWFRLDNTQRPKLLKEIEAELCRAWTKDTVSLNDGKWRLQESRENSGSLDTTETTGRIDGFVKVLSLRKPWRRTGRICQRIGIRPPSSKSWFNRTQLWKLKKNMVKTCHKKMCGFLPADRSIKKIKLENADPFGSNRQEMTKMMEALLPLPAGVAANEALREKLETFDESLYSKLPWLMLFCSCSTGLRC